MDEGNLQDEDLIDFAPEQEVSASQMSSDESTNPDQKPWKVLIVDDDEQIHAVTKFTLQNFRFKGRPIEFYSAYSGGEAREVLLACSDFAMVFLDVVMETTHAGLDLVGYIREDLRNSLIRIVIRTGQPGDTPEEKIIQDFDINDYRLKTDLTHHKIWTLTTACLRSYEKLVSLEEAKKLLTELNQSLEGKVKERTSELQQSNRDLNLLVQEKNSLLRTLSHDLKNYMNIIIGCVNIYQKPGEKSQEKLETLWHRVKRAAHHQKELIEHILELESLTSGKKTITLTRESVSQFYEQSCFVFKDQLKSKNIDFIFESQNQEMFVSVDPVLFGHHVINNIVSNAIKFSAVGSKIIFKAEEGADQNIICIKIIDQGVGIPGEIKDKLFDMGEKTSRTGTHGEQGTGFGMPIVKRYMELFQGTIDIDSVVAPPGSTVPVQSGTTFSLFLKNAEHEAKETL